MRERYGDKLMKTVGRVFKDDIRQTAQEFNKALDNVPPTDDATDAKTPADDTPADKPDKKATGKRTNKNAKG